MSAGKVERVIKSMLSDECFNEWMVFMNANDSSFNNLLSEHSHEQYSIFEQYTSLIEKQLECYCKVNGLTSMEFYQITKDYVDNASSVIISTFCSLILSSLEFQIFYDIMHDPSKRTYYFQIMRGWKSTLISNSTKKWNERINTY